MRVGLDFRFLGLDRQNGVRGIPRFTQEQLQSVLAADHESSYLLLCDPGNDLGAIRPEIRDAHNVQIVCAPDAAPLPFSPSDDVRTLLARYSAYQHWVETLRLDLYHATCHFWVSNLIMPGFDACPYVVTAYDLLPLLYPAQVRTELADAYDRGLLFLEQAARIGAISQTTADSLVEHLGVPANRIDVTRPAISPCFRPVSVEMARSILVALEHPARLRSRRRAGIPAEYVMCVTDFHYTKNLPTLLSAYAALASATRARFPLVIAGHLSKHDVWLLQRYAVALDIDRDVILTGRVSDPELMALYNEAAVMVHPSHHEGFGLTVGEAMRCGTPVITTTRSALPEVAGDAALLVDSEDVAAFTRAMDTVLHDADLRDDLSRRGRLVSERYTTEALGESTLRFYQTAVDTAPAASDASLRVALWSPLTSERAGVSDYTADVVNGLATVPGVELDLYVDDVPPPNDLMRVARVRHRSDYERCVRHAPYDAEVHQLGSLSSYGYVERQATQHPAIAVLHALSWIGSVGVVEAATSCVTPTLEAGVELLRRHPGADVRVIPIGVRDPWDGGYGFDRFMARAYLDVDQAAFAIVAPATCAEHINALMEATALLRGAGVNAILAVVGWLPQADVDALARRARRLGITSSFRMSGDVPRAVVDAYLAASSVVAVFADGDPGLTPAEALRACAAGRCLMVSDAPAFRSLPDSACIRVAQPPLEKSDVVRALVELARDGDRRAELERAARGHFEAAARVEDMTGRYLGLLREHAPTPAAPPVAAPASANRAARTARPAPSALPLPYNKVCELEDFAHPHLRDVLRAVCPHKRAAFGSEYPRGYEHRSDWEAAMAVRTLNDHGSLQQTARVLGMTSGDLDTLWYLTRECGEVVAIDTRARPLTIGGHAAPPFAVRADRLTVHDGAARAGRYPDGYFDGAVGEWRAGDGVDVGEIAAAVATMRRVVKVGGVISLAFDLAVSADSVSEPLPPGAMPLGFEDIERLVAESGLEPIDTLHRSVSHWTRSTVRDAAAAEAASRARLRQPAGAYLPAWARVDLPLVVLEHAGRRYTSVHLALRRA